MRFSKGYGRTGDKFFYRKDRATYIYDNSAVLTFVDGTTGTKTLAELAATAASTTFVTLTDTPANYTSAANKVVKVNTGGDALEFVTLSGDISINATGVSTIGAKKVTAAKTAIAAGYAWGGTTASSGAAVAIDISDGKLLVGDGTDVVALTCKTDKGILIGNGTTLASQQISGIISLANDGTTTWDAPAIANAEVDAAAAIVESKILFDASGHDHSGGANGKIVTVGIASNLANSVTAEAGGSDYTIDFGTAGGAHTLTVPAVSGDRTLAFINEAQSWSAVQTFTSPVLGAATATTLNKLTLTQPATSAVLTIVNGKTFTVNHTITLAGTDAQTYTFPASSDTVACLGTTQTLTANQTIEYGHLLLGDSDDGQTLQILVNENMTGDKTLTIKPNDGSRELNLSGNLTLASNFATTGDFTTSLTQSANVTLALPGANTTLAGHNTTNVFTNKSLDCDGTGNVLTNVNANELDPVTPGVGVYGVSFLIAQPLTNLPSTGTNIFVDNADFGVRIVRAWSVATTANGGTWTLHKGKIGALGNAITDTVTVAASDKDVDYATQINDAEHEIAENGSLVAVGDVGDSLDVILYVECIRV